jgi:hypothetical protein
LTAKLPLSDAEVVEALGEVARYEHLTVLPMPFLLALFRYLDRRVSRMGFPAQARTHARRIAKALLTVESAAETRLSERFAALVRRVQRNPESSTGGGRYRPVVRKTVTIASYLSGFGSAALRLASSAAAF